MQFKTFKKLSKNFLNYFFNLFGLTISKESSASRWKGFFKLLNKYQIEVNTFVNVGFAYGTDHIFKHIKPTNVFCIDPLPESYKHMQSFKKKYKDNNSGINFKIFNLALGEKKSKSFISVFNDIGGSTFLEQEGYAGSECKEKIEVDIVPFDDLDIEFKGVSLLKIDAQGFEIPILKGMKKSIYNFDYIFVESRFIETLKNSGTFNNLYKLMLEYDFEIIDILALTRRPLDDATTEIDVAFCKKDNPILNEKRWS